MQVFMEFFFCEEGGRIIIKRQVCQTTVNNYTKSGFVSKTSTENKISFTMGCYLYYYNQIFVCMLPLSVMLTQIKIFQ